MLVRDPARKLDLVHQWLDTWAGLGLVVAGMTHQGCTCPFKGASAASDLPLGRRPLEAARRRSFLFGRKERWSRTGEGLVPLIDEGLALRGLQPQLVTSRMKVNFSAIC